MVDTDRNNVRFVATVDSIIVRFHARYCSFHPTEKEYIEICLCLSILWHFWYGKVNYDTSSDNINCESSLFNLISSETYHFLTRSTPCNLRKRTSRRCRISIMRILGWWLWICNQSTLLCGNIIFITVMPMFYFFIFFLFNVYDHFSARSLLAKLGRSYAYVTYISSFPPSVSMGNIFVIEMRVVYINWNKIVYQSRQCGNIIDRCT